MPAIPYLDSYWVIQDQFLAGAYPGALDEESAIHRIQSLIHAGINTIIDLTRPEDTYYPYAKLLDKETQEFNIQIDQLNFPISDFDTPAVEVMTLILNTIDQRLEAGQRVYVHCVGGIGRTGTVVGCYLARHGLSGEEALIQLEYLRREAASWWRRSPESDYQIEFVRKWPTGK
jgi:protein-tyrosine phosphatase